MQIDLHKPILDKNDSLAADLRKQFAEKHVYVVDLLASPGSGKTSTILATIDALRDEFNIAVIEGDIASSVDAEKIKAQGIPAVQINTGGACHLESAMLKRAIDVLDLDRLDLIIVENVGNLVCPTDFDLGENAKVMILAFSPRSKSVGHTRLPTFSMMIKSRRSRSRTSMARLSMALSRWHAPPVLICTAGIP